MEADKRRSILHVDDDDGAALLVKFALQETPGMVDYRRVSEVSDALKCFLATENNEATPWPDLILLDLNLRDGNSGFELLKTVRDTERLAHILVVVFTFSAARQDRNKAVALGASAYICKPSTFEGYLLALQKIVEMMPPPRQTLPQPTLARPARP
jgi:CheY-like chemotaxis protein